ncbi:MAG: sensor histidine kinase [Coriobacteriales bacterium]
MSLLTVVLVIVLLIFNVVSYNAEIEAVRDALTYSLEVGPEGAGLPNVGTIVQEESGDFSSSGVSFESETVKTTDENGNVTTQSTVTVTGGSTDSSSGDSSTSASGTQSSASDTSNQSTDSSNSTTAQASDTSSSSSTQSSNSTTSTSTKTMEDRPLRDDNHIPVFCVTVDEYGNIISSSTTVSMDSSLLSSAVSEVLASDSTSGELSDLGLFYDSKEFSDGLRIAFADSSSIYQNNTNRIITSTLIGLATLAVLFVISMLLSKLALRPVEEAWSGQQRFIADASHELKTPLTVILADIDIVKSRPESTVSEQSRWIDGANEEALKMQGLVQDLLVLAQTEPDSVQVEGASKQFVTVDFSSLVEKDILQFEAVAFEKGVIFDDEIEEGLSVFADQDKLERVVRVLLDNAIKYSVQDEQPSDEDSGEDSVQDEQPSGEDSESVVKVRLNKDKSHAILKVNNGGKPISQEDLPHVFDRFYRSDKARSGNTEGFGLGLPIAKNIVNGIGGTITVDSNAVNGTTFTVRIPLAHN